MSRRQLWWTWVLATAAAETAGYAAAAVLFGLPGGGWLAGMAEGTCLGAAQALVLVRHLDRFPGAAWWLATAVVATAGWGAASTLAAGGGAGPESTLGAVALMGAALGAGMGTLLGAAQWLVLRRRLAPAWRWVPASAAGWGIGMVPAMIAATLPGPGAGVPVLLLLGASGGLLMGAAVGAVTGWQLVRLTPRAPDRVVSPAPRWVEPRW